MGKSRFSEAQIAKVLKEGLELQGLDRAVALLEQLPQLMSTRGCTRVGHEPIIRAAQLPARVVATKVMLNRKTYFKSRLCLRLLSSEVSDLPQRRHFGVLCANCRIASTEMLPGQGRCLI